MMGLDGNRMQIAAALQWLVDGQDIEDSANTVLSACRGLPVSRFSAGVAYDRGADHVGGFSPGHGQVTIGDGEQQRFVKSLGSQPERVGHFRIWRASANRIEFCHYWGYELGTQSEDGPPTEFVIEHTGDHRLVRYGAMDITTRRSCWCFYLTVNRFRLIAGSQPKAPIFKYRLTVGSDY